MTFNIDHSYTKPTPLKHGENVNEEPCIFRAMRGLSVLVVARTLSQAMRVLRCQPLRALIRRRTDIQTKPCHCSGGGGGRTHLLLALAI